MDSPWCFFGEEDIRCDNAATVAKAYHHRRGDASFIVSTHVVVDPCDRYGLTDISTTRDQKHGEVFCADRYVRLAQQHNVADSGDGTAQKREAVSMLQAIRYHSCGQGAHRGHNEYRNASDLRCGGRVAEFLNNGRDEELRIC